MAAIGSATGYTQSADGRWHELPPLEGVVLAVFNETPTYGRSTEWIAATVGLPVKEVEKTLVYLWREGYLAVRWHGYATLPPAFKWDREGATLTGVYRGIRATRRPAVTHGRVLTPADGLVRINLPADLAAKLAEVPEGAHVAITFTGWLRNAQGRGKRKQFQVEVKE